MEGGKEVAVEEKWIGSGLFASSEKMKISNSDIAKSRGGNDLGIEKAEKA